MYKNLKTFESTQHIKKIVLQVPSTKHYCALAMQVPSTTGYASNADQLDASTYSIWGFSLGAEI